MIDENGYKRGKLKHSDLIHRQIAYKEIYLKNRENYPLPFSEYVVHHKDENKKNNDVSNLQILTPPEHEDIHGINDYSSGHTYNGVHVNLGELSFGAGFIIFFIIMGILTFLMTWLVYYERIYNETNTFRGMINVIMNDNTGLWISLIIIFCFLISGLLIFLKVRNKRK